MRRDHGLLAGWLLAIVALTVIHDPWVLAALALVALSALLACEGVWAGLRLLLRTLVVLALINGAISLGYIALAEWRDEAWGVVVARLNLRVALLTLLALWLVRHIDPLRLSARWPALHFLIALTLGQIQLLRRLLREQGEAWRSRSPTTGWRGRLHASTRQTTALLEKAEAQSQALNEGMRARGLFDQRGADSE